MHYSATFSQLQEDFAGLGLHYGAAEAHGLLCGVLSASPHDGEEAWIRELFSHADSTQLEDPAGDPRLEAIRLLGRETRIGLIDDSDLFHLLLPDDESSQRTQGEALRDWSSGFLYGLGLNRQADDRRLSETAREGLRDLAEIANLDLESVEEVEEDAVHLAEVGEHLRVVATLLVEELTALQSERGGSDAK